MSKVVIFGIRDFAELAYYYLTHDSNHQVCAFCVNEEYLPDQKEFFGLPVVSLEQVETVFSPQEYCFFAPMSGHKMNRSRAAIYHEIKRKGYTCISYISSKVSRFNNTIGENCFILEDNTLQPFTNIGNNVVLWSGNHIGHHGRIHDHVMFTSHVVMSGHCIVEPYSFFGVNATLRDGITIAEGSLIAMSASVTASTEPWNIYKGVPAKKTGVSSKDINF